MLFLWGFPTGSPQKVLFHDVVLMRVSIGFLRENSISWRCSYADFWKNFGAVMVLLSGVINVCWIRQRFVPCVAGRLKSEPSFGAAGWPHLRCPLNVLSWYIEMFRDMLQSRNVQRLILHCMWLTLTTEGPPVPQQSVWPLRSMTKPLINQHLHGHCS